MPPLRLDAVHDLRHEIQPLLLVLELRTIAADDNWLSEAHGRDSLAIHFTWKPDVEGVSAFLTNFGGALAPFKARPHWGKLFTARMPLTLLSCIHNLASGLNIAPGLIPIASSSTSNCPLGVSSATLRSVYER